MEAESPQQPEPRFHADVQIGKGSRRIEPHGVATVAGGRLTLRKSTGEVIVEAPIGEVRASKHGLSAGAAARVAIGGDKYTLQLPGPGVTGVPGTAGSTVRGAGRIKRGRAFTKEFIAAVEAEASGARG